MKHCLYLILLLWTGFTFSQKQLPFADEVLEIQQRLDSVWDDSKETIVFTGSSSIRLWNDLQQRFPDQQILNTGFGGSQSSDLANYLNELILDYDPKKVFIYEGDNDISVKKRPKRIIQTFNAILNKLQEAKPQMEIVLISAKPSISRWRYRGKYRRFNRKLNQLAMERDQVSFVDVWSVMLDHRRLKKDLFVEDGLHMNPKGYELWYQAIKDFIPEAK